LADIDLNVLEEAIATWAQKVLKEKRGQKVEVVPGLPQMLTPQMYLSGEDMPVAFAFGKVFPVAQFLVVGQSSNFKSEFNETPEWVISAIENAWVSYFSNVSCQLGPWDSDVQKVRRLPASLNLRHIRYTVFVYENAHPKSAGYFDIVGVY
jgi:hypothetical protein